MNMPHGPYLIAILTLLNLSNYMDRYLVAPLGPLIQKDLGLSDTSLGLLGSAYIWGFLAASLATGAIARRWSRKTILLVSAAVWMVSTVALGWGSGLVWLLLFRIAIGLGQAAFTTDAPTVVDDEIVHSARGRALAVFYAAIPFGTAFAYIFGGLLGKIIGWQWTFILLGSVSLPLLLLLAESKFGNDANSKPRSTILQELLGLLKSHRYVLTVIGQAAQNFALGGFAFWAPTFLVRKFAYSAEQGSLIFGLILVATGLCGSIFGGWALDRLKDRDRVRAALKLGTLLMLVILPFGFLSLLTSSAWIFFVSMAIIQLAIFATFSPINSVYLGAVKHAARTSAIGYATFFGRLFGDLVSLWLIGIISDATGNLTLGLMILPIALIANFLTWFTASRIKK